MEYRNSCASVTCGEKSFMRCRQPCTYNYRRLRCECSPYLANEILNATKYQRSGSEECPPSHKYEKEDFGVLYCSDKPEEKSVSQVLAFVDPRFRLVDLVKDAGYLIRHPYTLLKSLTTGAVAGVLVFLVTSIVRNTCMVAMRAGGMPAIGMSTLFGITLTDATKLVGKNVATEIKTIVEGSVTRWIAAALPMSLLGATEENLFRDTLPKLMDGIRDRLEATIERVLKKISSGTPTPKQVQKIYGVIVCIVSSMAFGLFHLQNLLYFDRVSVYCQVVFTAVMGIFMSVLRRFSSLYSAWIAHFTHNFIAASAFIDMAVKGITHS